MKTYFNRFAGERERWQRRARYYHEEIVRLLQFLIPNSARVLEIGSGLGDLVAKLDPMHGIGIDISEEMVESSRERHPDLTFHVMDAEWLTLQETFEYVVLSDVVDVIEDVQHCFESLHRVMDEKSRVIITLHNPLWEWVLKILEMLRLKMPSPKQNWLSRRDVERILSLAGFDVVKHGSATLLPIGVPLVSTLVNRFIARLPLIRSLCLIHYVVARPEPATYSNKEYSVSVIIPARNEAGNIEAALERLPKLGSHTEVIFVEGGSSDDTRETIQRVLQKYHEKKDIVFVDQGNGKGKGDAVRKGFARASGDILMILDADLTVPPEDLPKYYHAIRTGKGDFVMGSRLIYPMEEGAMRFLNMLGNKFFGVAFSWILAQPIKDTLCGTKVLFKKDYEKLVRNRSYFGDFDPFGDFDLIFGAAKLNLKILEIPVRYGARTYGTTNISRFRHGWLLLKMTAFAARKLVFRR